MKRSMILMFILIAVAIYFLISRTSTPSPEASGGGSCGCNKGKDPVYLDDQQVILDQPSAYSEFAQTGNSLLV